MNVIKDIIMPIVKTVENAEKVEYEERENAVKVWIYANANEDILRQLSDLQYALMRKYGIKIDVVIK